LVLGSETSKFAYVERTK